MITRRILQQKTEEIRSEMDRVDLERARAIFEGHEKILEERLLEAASKGRYEMGYGQWENTPVNMHVFNFFREWARKRNIDFIVNDYGKTLVIFSWKKTRMLYD